MTIVMRVTDSHEHEHEQSRLGRIRSTFCANSYVKVKLICVRRHLVYAPGGTVHGFRYGKGGGQMLEITVQGSVASGMFTAINNKIPAGPPIFKRCLMYFHRTV